MEYKNLANIALLLFIFFSITSSVVYADHSASPHQSNSIYSPDYIPPGMYAQNYWLNKSPPQDSDDYLIKAQEIKVISQVISN